MEQFKVTLVCLFCGSALKAPDDASYKSGDLIDCGECGESNDFDSVVAVAEEKAVEQVGKQLTSDLERALQNFLN